MLLLYDEIGASVSLPLVPAALHFMLCILRILLSVNHYNKYDNDDDDDDDADGDRIKQVTAGEFVTTPELDMGQPDPTQDFPDPTRPSMDRPMKNIVNLFCVQRIM